MRKTLLAALVASLALHAPSARAQVRVNPAITENLPPPSGAAGIAPLPGDALTTGVTGVRAAIGPGDLLEIGVFDSPEYTQRVRVDGDGKIHLALVGGIKAQGLSADALRQEIRDRLVEGHFIKDPQVSLLVIEYAGQMVYVSGEVNRPGAYSLLRDYRLMDLIAVAGGFTAHAGNALTIAHASDAEHPVHVTVGSGEPDSNPLIAPGDSVTVGPAGIVYVLGDVTRPGGFVIDRRTPLTVLQALALAEGPTQVASLTKATLIHSTEHDPQPIPVNIRKMVKTEEPDPALQAGDIIWVADSQTRNLGRLAISTILATASGVAIYAAYPH